MSCVGQGSVFKISLQVLQNYMSKVIKVTLTKFTEKMGNCTTLHLGDCPTVSSPSHRLFKFIHFYGTFFVELDSGQQFCVLLLKEYSQKCFGFVLFNVRFGLKVKLSALKTIVRASNLDKMVIPFSVISEQMTLKCR